MCNVLIGVSAWRDSCVQLLQVDPFPTRVVRGPEDEAATRPEDSTKFVYHWRVLGNVLDYLGREYATEGGVGERQCKARGFYERYTKATVEPKLPDEDVKGYAAFRQGSNYPTGSATHVEYSALSSSKLLGNSEPLALPVALQRYGAIVGPVVIVRCFNGVAQFPQTPEGTEVRASKCGNPCGGAAVLPGHIVERDSCTRQPSQNAFTRISSSTSKSDPVRPSGSSMLLR